VRIVRDRTAEAVVDRDRDVDRDAGTGADITEAAGDQAGRFAAARGGAGERDTHRQLIGEVHVDRGAGAVVGHRQGVGDRVAVLDDATRIVHLHDRHVGFDRHVVPADGEVAHRVVPAIQLLWGVEIVVAGIARRIAEQVAAARSALHEDAMDRKGRGPVREPCRSVVARDGDRHGAARRLAVARDRDPVIEAELAAVVVR
jgi:hypothetical protein